LVHVRGCMGTGSTDDEDDDMLAKRCQLLCHLLGDLPIGGEHTPVHDVERGALSMIVD